MLITVIENLSGDVDWYEVPRGPCFFTCFMSSICIQRLTEERKQWRKDHPFGFYARPDKNGDAIDLTSWSVGILE